MSYTAEKEPIMDSKNLYSNRKSNASNALIYNNEGSALTMKNQFSKFNAITFSRERIS